MISICRKSFFKCFERVKSEEEADIKVIMEQLAGLAPDIITVK